MINEKLIQASLIIESSLHVAQVLRNIRIKAVSRGVITTARPDVDDMLEICLTRLATHGARVKMVLHRAEGVSRLVCAFPI